jgi:hypothetical protein
MLLETPQFLIPSSISITTKECIQQIQRFIISFSSLIAYIFLHCDFHIVLTFNIITCLFQIVVFLTSISTTIFLGTKFQISIFFCFYVIYYFPKFSTFSMIHTHNLLKSYRYQDSIDSLFSHDSIFSSSPTHISSIIFFSFQLPYPPIITWPTSILFYFILLYLPSWSNDKCIIDLQFSFISFVFN